MTQYRLYIDESGDHLTPKTPKQELLALAGVIVQQSKVPALRNDLEGLKQNNFPYDPDRPLILVRNRIVNREPPFGVLSNPKRNSQWESQFLSFLERTEFRLATVITNKRIHRERHREFAYDPYDWCMEILVEKYCKFLRARKAVGDVMAESRNKPSNEQLKQAYARVWQNGTHYLAASAVQAALTTKQLKIEQKERNIAGLQLVDLVAVPSKREILFDLGLCTHIGRYEMAIIDVIQKRYVLGGRKFLK
jgi:hypothetical protein